LHSPFASHEPVARQKKHGLTRRGLDNVFFASQSLRRFPYCTDCTSCQAAIGQLNASLHTKPKHCFCCNGTRQQQLENYIVPAAVALKARVSANWGSHWEIECMMAINTQTLFLLQ